MRIARARRIAKRDVLRLPETELEDEMVYEMYREKEIDRMMDTLAGDGGEKSKLSPEAWAALAVARL